MPNRADETSIQFRRTTQTTHKQPFRTQQHTFDERSAPVQCGYVPESPLLQFRRPLCGLSPDDAFPLNSAFPVKRISLSASFQSQLSILRLQSSDYRGVSVQPTHRAGIRVRQRDNEISDRTRGVFGCDRLTMNANSMNARRVREEAATRVCPWRREWKRVEAIARTSTGRCPFHPSESKTGEILRGEIEEVVTPGPRPLSLTSAWDVSKILRFGIHEAMLRFFEKYGPICR